MGKHPPLLRRARHHWGSGWPSWDSFGPDGATAGRGRPVAPLPMVQDGPSACHPPHRRILFGAGGPLCQPQPQPPAPEPVLGHSPAEGEGRGLEAPDGPSVYGLSSLAHRNPVRAGPGGVGHLSERPQTLLGPFGPRARRGPFEASKNGPGWVPAGRGGPRPSSLARPWADCPQWALATGNLVLLSGLCNPFAPPS